MNTFDCIELQKDVNNLMNWSEEWQMLFNVDKCSGALWKIERESQLFYECSKLDEVSEEKDLGIWISNDLKVSQQCVQAYSKANNNSQEFSIEQ